MWHLVEILCLLQLNCSIHGSSQFCFWLIVALMFMDDDDIVFFTCSGGLRQLSVHGHGYWLHDITSWLYLFFVALVTGGVW